MSTEEVNVLIFLGYALFNGFIAYQFGKEDGWLEGFGDGWAAHKRVSKDIEKFSQALFDTGTFWGNDEQAEESGCGATIPSTTIQETATAAWNRRAETNSAR